MKTDSTAIGGAEAVDLKESEALMEVQGEYEYFDLNFDPEAMEEGCITT